MVVKERCTDFAAVDKAISQTRAWEKKYKLNGGNNGDDGRADQMTIRVPGGFDD